jgi:hypothetical protein
VAACGEAARTAKNAISVRKSFNGNAFFDPASGGRCARLKPQRECGGDGARQTYSGDARRASQTD